MIDADDLHISPAREVWMPYGSPDPTRSLRISGIKGVYS
jgi:hypothetical protein